MSVNLYYTQKIRGFQQQKAKYTANSVHFSPTWTKLECRCGFRQVTIRSISKRQVHREPMGNCREVVFVLLQSGAVIHVGEGKDVSALSGALNKLKQRKLKIVTTDMANAYYSWINQEFSNVKIVFDHFYVIKLMNDKLDKARRRVTVKLNITQQKLLKGLRFIFLKNNENLPEEAKIILQNMRGKFQELGDAYIFKEALRVIY